MLNKAIEMLLSIWESNKLVVVAAIGALSLICVAVLSLGTCSSETVAVAPASNEIQTVLQTVETATVTTATETTSNEVAAPNQVNANTEAAEQ